MKSIFFACVVAAATLIGCAGGQTRAVTSAPTLVPTEEPTAAPTTPGTPLPPIWDPEIGQQARVHVEGGPGQIIGLANSTAALDQFQKALRAHDDVGVRDLLVLGLLFSVDNDTKVLVIDDDCGFFSGCKYRVRVLEGKQQTRAGWVIEEVLAKP